MYTKFHEFNSKLDAVTDDSQAWDLLIDFTDSLGVCHVHTWFGSSIQNVSFYSTCPDWWMPHYMEHEFWKNDTLAAHCMTSHGVRPYGVDAKGTAPGESDGTEEILNFMKSTIGLGAGVGFPVFLPDGIRIGGINIGYSGTIEDMAKLPATELLETMMAATAAHTKIHQLCNGGQSPLPHLSPREGECLLHLASGLRTKEISHKLKVSDATVAFHIQNAKRKLGAETREQAVAKAIILGLVTP